MLFEIFGSDKNRKMYTDSIFSIPDASTLRILAATGYKFKYQGKDISATRLINEIYSDSKVATAQDEPDESAENDTAVEVSDETPSANKQHKENRIEPQSKTANTGAETTKENSQAQPSKPISNKPAEPKAPAPNKKAQRKLF